MLKSKWKKTAALAAGLAALGGWAYWLEYKKRPETERKESIANKAFPLQDVGVKRLSIQYGSDRFSFDCLDTGEKLCRAGDQSQWALTEPIAANADAANVNALLSMISAIALEESVDLSAETPDAKAALLKDYGLSENDRREHRAKEIRVELGDGRKHSLWVGEPHSIGDRVYVLQGDSGETRENTVRMASYAFKSLFTHDLDHWRDKTLLRIAAKDIGEYEYAGGGQEYSVRKKDGVWTLEARKPKKATYLVSPEKAEAYLSALSTLAAKRFLVEDKATAEGKKELASLKLQATLRFRPSGESSVVSSSETVLRLYEKKAGKEPLYAAEVAASPFVVEIDAATRNRLVRDIDSLRMGHLIASMERFTTRSIRFSGGLFGEKGLKISHEDQRWNIRDGDETRPADAEKVMAFLGKFASVNVAEFSPKGAPSRPARNGSKDGFDVELEADDGAAHAFRFWMRSGAVYVKDLRSKTGETFRMEAAWSAGWPKDAHAFDPAAPASEATPTSVSQPPSPPAHPEEASHGNE